MTGSNPFRKSSAGLSLLEVLIMFVVFGVVGAITIPKFKTMLYQSREGRTKVSLGELRGAMAIYYSDHFGLYPPDTRDDQTRLADSIVPRYFKSMPVVELPHFHSKLLSTVQDHFDDRGDWMYSAAQGFVAVNCSHADTQGKPASSW